MQLIVDVGRGRRSSVADNSEAYGRRDVARRCAGLEDARGRSGQPTGYEREESEKRKEAEAHNSTWKTSAWSVLSCRSRSGFEGVRHWLPRLASGWSSIRR